MKKDFFVKTCAAVLSIGMIVSVFSGCQKDTPKKETKTTEKTKPIQFWYFNKDEAAVFKKTFEEKFKGYTVKVQIIPDADQGYQTKIQQLINSGSKDMPDVFAGESAFIKRLVDLKGGFDDLTKAPYKANDLLGDMYDYTIGVGKDSDNVLRALSHQATVGGLGYKRDLTKKYLGTDDPDKVSEMMSTPEKILETGAKLTDGAQLFSGPEDLYRLYFGARKDPWVKDKKFVIDPKINEFIKLTKDLKEKKLIGEVQAWKPAWDAAIKDDKHLFFAIPTWGVPYIIAAKDADNKDKGRWGVTKPMYPYSWGGTWFGISQKSENKEAAWKFVKFITTDLEAMEARARSTGDFGNSKKLANKLAKDDTMVNKTINQNTYKLWQPLAEKVDAKLFTKYDDSISLELNNIMLGFVNEKSTLKTEDDVISKFKEGVKNVLQDQDITVK